jgi:hypothetical protein
MIRNRISHYMELPPKRSKIVRASQIDGPTLPQTVLTPPPNFVPVPVSMLANVPQSQFSWPEELYRLAYEAARASVAAASTASDRYRWN